MKKNQHVVPRSYLRNFENSDGKVFAYNWVTKKVSEAKIENICSHKYTYEVSNKCRDNILEDELSHLEAEFMPSIQKVIDDINDGILTQKSIDCEMLYKYIMLQYMRTDSGRIMVLRALKGMQPLDHHMDLKEIKLNENLIREFNLKFKTEDELQNLLDKYYIFDHPMIRVGKTTDRKLLTSDNPVIAYYVPNKTFFESMKLVLPISPNICLYCFSLDHYRKYQTEQLELPYYLDSRLVDEYNQSIVNVSNYWVVSQEKFNLLDYNLLYNRKTK